MPRISARAETFGESVIRDMTRLALRHEAVNLAQGFPDFPCPPELKEAAKAALDADINQYAITWGAKRFRAAISAKTSRTYPRWSVDPDTQVTVVCGATEGMISAMLAILDPGDEIVVFEPFYENYGPDAILAGAVPRLVTLHEPDWSFDEDKLARAFGERTRAIVLNSPNNPTGKVFAREELEAISRLCAKWDAIAITDEIYEHITYDGARHVPIATIPGMEHRTVTISALSKTYAVTGWRVGWALASPELIAGIRPVHDFLTVGAPTPLQHAAVTALGLPETYYEGLAREHEQRRALMMEILEESGFKANPVRGAYYVMADISGFGFESDTEFAMHLVRDVGVAVVPGSSFFSRPELGRQVVRFSFCKRLETLREAGERLGTLSRRG